LTGSLVIEQVIADKLSRDPAWQVHLAGALDVLPDTTAQALKRAAEASRDCTTGARVTLAVGYGGRQKVIDAFRSLLYEQAARGTTLAELAETITNDDIARHLYTAGQPDPDLVIRTSGEQRLSNFLLWQSAYSDCTSARPTGLRSARSTFSARSAASPPGAQRRSARRACLADLVVPGFCGRTHLDGQWSAELARL
jgi:hypothetical protein